MFWEVFSETKHRKEAFDTILDLSCNCAYYWPILISIVSAFFILLDQKRSVGCLLNTSWIAALWQNMACQVKNTCGLFFNSISILIQSFRNSIVAVPYVVWGTLTEYCTLFENYFFALHCILIYSSSSRAKIWVRTSSAMHIKQCPPLPSLFNLHSMTSTEPV